MIVGGNPLPAIGSPEWEQIMLFARIQNLGPLLHTMHASEEVVEYSNMEDLGVDLRRRRSSVNSISDKARVAAEYDLGTTPKERKRELEDEMCCSYGSHFRLDPKHWQPLLPFPTADPLAPDTGESPLAFFKMHEKARPSAAVDSIFKPGWMSDDQTRTLLECSSMMVAEQHRALKAALGARDFDALVKKEGGMITPMFESTDKPTASPADPIGCKSRDYTPSPKPVQTQADAKPPQSPLLRFYKRVEVVAPPGQPTQNLLPGDWVYLANHPDYVACESVVSEMGKKRNQPSRGLWSGEHAVYVGEGKFSGFGMAEASYEQILTTFAGNTNSMCEEAIAYCDPVCEVEECENLPKGAENRKQKDQIPGLKMPGKDTIRVWRLDTGALMEAVRAAKTDDKKEKSSGR